MQTYLVTISADSGDIVASRDAKSPLHALAGACKAVAENAASGHRGCQLLAAAAELTVSCERQREESAPPRRAAQSHCPGCGSWARLHAWRDRRLCESCLPAADRARLDPDGRAARAAGA